MSNTLQATLHEVAVCPLCGDAHTDARSAPQANLYSEQLALLTGSDEAVLLRMLENRRCVTCGLWYKARWFSPAVLTELFGALVPDHPKGWDAVSDRFSVQGFAAAVEDLRLALNTGNMFDQARTRRAIGSIFDSLQIDDGDLRTSLGQAIAADHTEQLALIGPALAPYFAEPVPFKRFSGFSSPLLWDWMVAHIGAVQQYGEIGCPLWGQLVKPAGVGVQRFCFTRAEANYWGAGCQRGGQHCSARLLSAGHASIGAWPPRAGEMLDAVGAFQYLDHLEAPGAFVEEVFAHSRALLLILDDGGAPSAIQHPTGWDARPLTWLARRHGKRLIDDFAPIAGSGNHAWLLCDG